MTLHHYLVAMLHLWTLTLREPYMFLMLVVIVRAYHVEIARLNLMMIYLLYLVAMIKMHVSPRVVVLTM